MARLPFPARVALLGAGAAALAGGVALADARRRERLERMARVWRLTARRSLGWTAVKVRGRALGATEEERARLEERFAVRSAQDVAEVLGGMKGVMMKAGQMVSFLFDGLPPEAQAALATLQSDVPPMAPSLAEAVVREELGAPPERLFLEWDPVPVAAASIGQVHRAVLPDGRVVAVKVQYPGLDQTIGADLDNAETLYAMLSAFALKNLDAKALVDELRARMGDELDYRIEARNQAEFAARYAGHPFVRVPAVVPERSARRVLTSEWVSGQRFEEFLASSTEATRQRAGEVLMRFAHGSIHRHGVFNGDPHPGNYRFSPDGSITFLDFGLVKRWSPGEWEHLSPVLDALLSKDPRATLAAMVAAGFLPRGHGLDPDFVFDYVSTPWEPYLVEHFTYTRGWVTRALQHVVDLQGRYGDLVRRLNVPASYVILDRVMWGGSALLARLEATNSWRALLAEYREGAPPSTELGELEARWAARVAS